jgi:LuxR family transcriptional regulator, quorum-sensing system regulator BjaR1
VAPPRVGGGAILGDYMLEQHAFDAVELLRHCNSFEEVKTVYGKACQLFGLSAFIICDIPPGVPPGEREVYTSGWNENWLTRYVERNYSSYDPIPNHVNTTVNPYYWQDAERHSIRGPKSKIVMNEARSDFGMVDGYCVPIHGLKGISGVVSVATEMKKWQLSEKEEAALHMISIYAYEAVRKIRGGGNTSGGGPKISRRELECIRWLAEGKTTWEIGTILGIAEDTVGKYIKSASRKFGTSTRAHLVARAHRFNYLR